MAILISQIEAAERRWDYVYSHDETERERNKALDEMIALKVLYRKITNVGYQKISK